MQTAKNASWILWSSKLSPFGIKMDALLRQADIPFSWYPEQSRFSQGAKALYRLKQLQRGRLEMTWPPVNALQEFPQVPYVLGPEGENLYDSSAIGEWLAQRDSTLAILPPAQTAEGFLVRLIDEALDEFGLYMVHHNRWVHAAADNTAGSRLAAEMKPLLGPASAILRTAFPRRQVRRLPYLFSVAENRNTQSALPYKLQAPPREGFPPTHLLLDRAFSELLSALEGIFAQRPYLMGDTMTLADASVLGQLGMNKTDPGAWSMIVEQAPLTAQWIDRNYLQKAAPIGENSQSAHTHCYSHLQALAAWCCRYFVPLMQQNYRAYQYHLGKGETLFNEAAFDQQRALYQGALDGQPFKNVAKTFQVAVWEKLQNQWQCLSLAEKTRMRDILPSEHGLDDLSGVAEIIPFAAKAI